MNLTVKSRSVNNVIRPGTNFERRAEVAFENPGLDVSIDQTINAHQPLV
tara:strand:+ start:688 stop:834 length:147 start_codon:yes stop_codon:yes gene_type:complete